MMPSSFACPLQSACGFSFSSDEALHESVRQHLGLSVSQCDQELDNALVIINSSCFGLHTPDPSEQNYRSLEYDTSTNLYISYVFTFLALCLILAEVYLK